MNGGIIIDIVKVNDKRWWINTLSMSPDVPTVCAIYVNPKGHALEVGDHLTWRGRIALCVGANAALPAIELEKVSYSNMLHPDCKDGEVPGLLKELLKK